MSVLLVLLSYLLGSIPFAYIAGRVFKGIDIRNFGDGNVGAVNAYRGIGPAAGVAVLIADVSKGAIAVLVAQAFASQLVTLLAGFAVVTGHNWPIYIGFRGGRGQATTIGVLCALLPRAMFILLAVCVVPFLVTRNTKMAGVFLSSENVTLIVQRICHPLSICTLKGLRQGWSGPGLILR